MNLLILGTEWVIFGLCALAVKILQLIGILLLSC